MKVGFTLIVAVTASILLLSEFAGAQSVSKVPNLDQRNTGSAQVPVGQSDTTSQFQKTIARVKKTKTIADWQITAIKLASEGEEKRLRSGDRPKLIVSVDRFDKNKEMPDAVLTVSFVPSNVPVNIPPQNIYLNQPGDGQSKSYPVYFDIPTIGNNGRPIGTTNIVITAKLSFPLGSQAAETNINNDMVMSSVFINRPTPKKEYAFEDFRIDLNESFTTEIAGTNAPDFTEIVVLDEGISRPMYRVDFDYVRAHGKACGGKIFGTKGYGNSKQFGKDACGPSKSGTRFRTYSFQQASAVESNNMITGIAICQATNDNRLLGVRTKSRRIRSDGSFGLEVRYHDEDWNGLCTNWSKIVECPDVMAAAGLSVAYNSGGGSNFRRSSTTRSDYIQGISLVCGPIVPKEGA